MEGIAGEGRTVLFVSHNMSAVRKLCKQVVLLQGGEMILKGDTEHVILKYLSSSPLNKQSEITLPVNNPGSPGKGIKICFVSDDGIPQSQFRIGQVWHIILEFEMFKSTAHVIAGISMGTIDAISIITYWSKPKDLIPGRYRVIFNCDLPLAACELQITVGLSENLRDFYYFEAVGRVSISEVSVGEQPVISSGVGLLVNHKVVEIEPMHGSSVS
jgi:lipopolysaccharide transport system ATP-binding protein